MLLATLASLALKIVPFIQAVEPVAPVPAQDPVSVAQREADVCNYVTTRLRLLKRGVAVKDLKSELVDEIDYGAIPPRSVAVLKRLSALCDQALANQAKIELPADAIDAPDSGADAAAPIVAALSRLPQSAETSSARSELFAKSAGSLSAEISAMETDLVAFRNQVQADGKLPPTEFVNPADCDQFLEAAAKSSDADRIAGVSAALDRSPRLQPAALHIAEHFFRARSFPRCLEYADQVIDQAPRILKRDALRGRAYLFEAVAAHAEGDYPLALKLADLGLKDDPANPSLLFVKAECTVRNGGHAEALPILEKLTRSLPRNPSVLYSLACCVAVVKKDAVAAMDEFKAALDLGFPGIEQSKMDPDLALLREKFPVEFQSLTTLRLGFEVDWHTLSPHSVILWNESRFPLADVHVSLTFLAHDAPKGANTSEKIEREVVVSYLAPGAKQVFPGLLDTSPKQLTSLHLLAECTQGRFEAIYPARDLLLRRRQAPKTP